jgi:hypothetical protein
MRAGRNDPCPCGSGKKYKKCCWEKDLEKESTQLAPTPLSFEGATERLGPASLSRNQPTPAQRRWDEFERADYPGQIALFQRTLDEGLMDDENALSMLETLHTATIENGQRQQFLDLSAALRRQAPQAFENRAVYFINWEIEAVLALGQRDRLPALLDELALLADANTELFRTTVDHLAYRGELDLLLGLLRSACSVLRVSTTAAEWEVDDYCEEGLDLEIRAALEANPETTGHEPDLLQRLRSYADEIDTEDPEELEMDDLDLEVVLDEIELLAGRCPISEQVADYEWERQEDEAWEEDEDEEVEDEDEEDPVPDEASERISNLVLAFQGEARQEGVPWTRSLLAGRGIIEYLLDSGMGYLQDDWESINIDHPLCPDSDSLEWYLDECLDFLDTRKFQAFATYELLPAWLRFLREHDLLDAEQHARAFADLARLKKKMASLAESDRSDPLLGHGLAAWDAPPKE